MRGVCKQLTGNLQTQFALAADVCDVGGGLLARDPLRQTARRLAPDIHEERTACNANSR